MTFCRFARNMVKKKMEPCLSISGSIKSFQLAPPGTPSRIISPRNLLTGKAPKIAKTLELFPIGRQDTKEIKLFGGAKLERSSPREAKEGEDRGSEGSDRYTIDLTKDDLFTTVIDARIDVQKELETASDERKPFLASSENVLKILANGTSYGVFVEFIVDDRLEETPTTVFYGGSSTRVEARLHKVGKDGDTEISDYKVETAGKFFAPFGALIPAGGRLLLNRGTSRRGPRTNLCILRHGQHGVLRLSQTARARRI
jgi:hypothetical protein